jgi:ATP-dependent Clp protease, protease subunit
MATAYIFFGKTFNPDTATALIQASRALMGDKNPNAPAQFLWDHFHYSMSSGGGDIISAFAAFNELKGLPLKVTTHNAGAIDSAAIMPFMVGSRRTASHSSAFFFHQLQWTFASNANLTMTTINDATKWLGTYENLMAEFVSDQSELEKSEVLKMMREGTSVLSTEAKAMGLIHDVEECSIPQDARSWQV